MFRTENADIGNLSAVLRLVHEIDIPCARGHGCQGCAWRAVTTPARLRSSEPNTTRGRESFRQADRSSTRFDSFRESLSSLRPVALSDSQRCAIVLLHELLVSSYVSIPASLDKIEVIIAQRSLANSRSVGASFTPPDVKQFP
jgi:hypothetical protein